jgi:tetratricopeptide (TPR) repeat protein
VVGTTLAQARRMQAPRAIALCQCFNGALEFQAGHWEEAESALHESIKLYRDLGAAAGEALARQRLGVLQTTRGQFDEALRSFEEGIIVAERAVMRAHCLTRLYASMTHNRLMVDDIEAAHQYLALGLTMSERHGNCTTCHALLLPVAVSVRIAQGDFAAAEAFCRQLDEAAAQYASSTWVAMARQSRGALAVLLLSHHYQYHHHVAMARQSRGALAAAQGNLDDALRYYAEAQARFAAAGNEYEAARCLSTAASLRLIRSAPGDTETADAELAEARHIFEQLGAA